MANKYEIIKLYIKMTKNSTYNTRKYGYWFLPHYFCIIPKLHHGDFVTIQIKKSRSSMTTLNLIIEFLPLY